MDLISIQNVSYQYPASGEELPVPVLQNVSLSIKKGEFVAILGRNGSGKSTLAKLCNGMLKPQQGQVLVEGVATTEEAQTYFIRSHVGLVLQNPDNQIVASIVEEDVAFGPENLGVPPREIRQRVDKALTAVDMLDYKEKAPHQLSGGQKQRVAIAGVLAMEPDCIVLDEPTAMLDPKGRNEVLNTLLSIHKRGITVVLITHFMEEAIPADRVVVLEQGEILTEGTPREVFAQEELLVEHGLAVPQVTALCHRLRVLGVPLPAEVLTEQECLAALQQARLEVLS